LQADFALEHLGAQRVRQEFLGCVTLCEIHGLPQVRRAIAQLRVLDTQGRTGVPRPSTPDQDAPACQEALGQDAGQRSGGRSRRSTPATAQTP